MDAQAQTYSSAASSLLESNKEFRLNMPGCKAGALGEDCLGQNSIH